MPILPYDTATMFAVINTGGKQYIVREGQQLKIEKIVEEPGAKVSFDALLVAEDDGSKVSVGKPTVAGAKIEAQVVEHGKGPKIDVVKYKQKSRYTRHTGHRQPFTKILITKV
jgi:large subunit ribosomal protein L21